MIEVRENLGRLAAALREASEALSPAGDVYEYAGTHGLEKARERFGVELTERCAKIAMKLAGELARADLSRASGGRRELRG